MAKKRHRATVCHHCKSVLQVRQQGPCRTCGAQLTVGHHGVHSERVFKHSRSCDTRRDFYEAHKRLAIVMILIIFTFPIAGVFLGGIPGLLFGVASSVLGYYLLPHAVHAVRRISGAG